LLASTRPLRKSLRLLFALLHHSAHIHLGKSGRRLEQGAGLRAFLNIAKFSAVVLAPV
jgi:hypothetical protein